MRALGMLAAVALPGAVWAQDCADRDGIPDRTDCLAGVYAAADAALNRVWPQVMRDHPSGGDRDRHRREIRAAQRAWIAFRDADCQAASKTGIPAYWELNRLSCLIAHTQARTAALTETYLD